MLLARSAVAVLFVLLPSLVGLFIYFTVGAFAPEASTIPFEDTIPSRMLRLALVQWVPAIFCTVVFQGA